MVASTRVRSWEIVGRFIESYLLSAVVLISSLPGSGGT
jgi:hypothetical protein